MAVNHAIYCVDKSSSVEALMPSIQAMVEQQFKVLKDDTENTNFVSVYSFADEIETHFVEKRPEEVATPRFHAYGNTNMFGAALKAGQDHKNRSSENYLLVIITDGQHNSPRVSSQQFLEFLKERDALKNWTVVINVPTKQGWTDYKGDLITKFGVPAANIQEWECTVAGVEKMAALNAVSTQGYLNERSKGIRETKSFYKVDLDVSKVTAADLTKLKDVTDSFKILKVAEEHPVKVFVEFKMKKPYVIGSAYYQLTKPEKIQANKAIVIMKNGEKKIYGGSEARKLIGLPEGQDGKVSPKNLSEYKVFCASTSVNRLLVRGTELLVDVKKTKDDKETWDSKAAAANK